MNLVFFAIAAGIGGFVRFLVEQRIQPIGKDAFPRATLYVNLTGAFLLGLVFSAPESLYTIIGIAFCGALTTFSGISAQLMRRVSSGAIWAATSYVVITFGIGLVLAQLGLLIGDFIFN